MGWWVFLVKDSLTDLRQVLHLDDQVKILAGNTWLPGRKHVTVRMWHLCQYYWLLLFVLDCVSSLYIRFSTKLKSAWALKSPGVHLELALSFWLVRLKIDDKNHSHCHHSYWCCIPNHMSKWQCEATVGHTISLIGWYLCRGNYRARGRGRPVYLIGQRLYCIIV